MIEIPEAKVIANQLNSTLSGKTISYGIAGMYPGKFTWYSGKPSNYTRNLFERKIVRAYNYAARIFLEMDNKSALIFGEGTVIKFHEAGSPKIKNHKLLLEFSDESFLTVLVRKYGFVLLENIDSLTNKYIIDSVEIPSPLGSDFTLEYFQKLFADNKKSNLSTKAFLSADHRIPGIGNGGLHDILFNAGIHPKLKLKDYKEGERDNLYNAIIGTLEEMAYKGGRDSEKDIFGKKGGYKCKMSRHTVGNKCPDCESVIVKESFLGGSIYFCPKCQRKE